MSSETKDRPVRDDLDGIKAVRVGHGANCSSIGSVIDTVFASAVVGGAIFATIAAALAREEVRVVGAPKRDAQDAEEGTPDDEREAP